MHLRRQSPPGNLGGITTSGGNFVTYLLGRRQTLLAGAGVLAGSVRRASAADTVRFGSVGGLTDAGVLLGTEYGYFTPAGFNVEHIRLPSAPALLTAIATGQLDVAGIAVTPGLFTASQRGIQLRIVGDKQSVRPGFSATRLVVRTALHTGNEAETAKRLRGKIIAVSSKAAGIYMVVLRYLKSQGIGPHDVRFVELAYPSMVPALTSGAVDAAALLEPFLTKALQMNVAKQQNDLVAASDAASGESATTVPMVYSETFARKHDLAQGFMNGYMRGVRMYNDAFAKGIDKEKVIAVLSRRAHLDAKVIRDGFPAGLDPNQHVGRKFLEDCQTFFVQQHDMQKPIDLGKVIDESFAQAAVARLGKYS